MRIRFSEDEEFNNAAILWEANQERSLKSRKGQLALRRLEAALLALPEPKLVADAIKDSDGVVCALGALAINESYQGDLELPQPPAPNAPEAEWDKWYVDHDDDYGSRAVEEAMLALAESLDVPKMVAIAIIAENDNEYGIKTPEDRYRHVLSWTRSWLNRDRSTWTKKNMEGYIT